MSLACRFNLLPSTMALSLKNDISLIGLIGRLPHFVSDITLHLAGNYAKEPVARNYGNQQKNEILLELSV